LISKRSTIITSTHYSQVKTYGKANDSVLVSSVEFNPETLKPTYKYIPGVSGASYAFHIAREYNLEESILERADFLKNENEKQTEKELEKLEKLQNDVLKQKERFNQLIEDAHRVQKEAYEKEKEIEKRKAQLDASYQEQLNEMLEKKKAEAKEILTVLRKEKTGKQHKQIEKMHELDLLNEHVEEIEDDKKEFKVGDYVKITGLNSHGEIVDIRRNEATVLTNGMKMKVKISKLEPMHKPQIKKATYKAHVESVSSRFPLELNLIGMRVEEGIAALDKYLDQAVVKHIKQVRIIHGMGTGALRTAVWKDLKKQPNVSKFNSAGPSEGGLGATIVILK
jgi:DNA mismatch repair protein MutS2